MKALHIVELERESVIEAEPGERVEQLARALALAKPGAERLPGVAQRADAGDVADPRALAVTIDQPRARDGEQVGAKAGVAAEPIAVAHAREQGLLDEVLRVVGGPDLVVEEPVELVEVATEQLAAGSPITFAPGREQLRVAARSFAHRITIRDHVSAW